MHHLDLTLDEPQANLALDEVLLDEAERSGESHEILRTWEFKQPTVVLGRSSQVKQETIANTCMRDNVPVLRRCSGGAAIVAGPGCLMYSLVLSYSMRPQLKMIDQVHLFVLERIQACLQSLDISTDMAGTSDLAHQNMKFSGNSLRSKRTHLLYHGTLLYDFPLSLISKYLSSPPRQPAYRQGRDHDRFVANLPVARSRLQDALRQAWEPLQPRQSWPREQTEKLVASKYSQECWNQRF